MNKVYLLLRNNKQSGPHALEELMTLGLKPSDLIWIEGKSLGWSYPSEINALKPYVATVTETTHEQIPAIQSQNNTDAGIDNEAYMPTGKGAIKSNEPTVSPKVFVSMPSNVNRTAEPIKQQPEAIVPLPVDPIEQKAEALRKKIQSYVPEQKPAVKAEEPSATKAGTKRTEVPVTTKYFSTIAEREEAYTSWIYDSKKSKSKGITEIQKNWGSIVIAALLILVIGYGISQYHGDNKEVELAASSTISDANKTVPEPLITEPETPATQPIIDNVSSGNSVESNVVESNSEPAKKIINSKVAPEKKSATASRKSTSVTDADQKAITKTPVKEVPVVAPVVTKAEPLNTVEKKESEAVAASPKKKKSLNEKVDAFFSKFSRKVEQTPVSETPPPAGSTSSNSFPGTVERKAAHRDDKPVADKPAAVAAAPSNINLAEYVEITSTKPSENWMLGVHGLKVSVRNKSSETVKTAEVEFRYYSEENEVLEKKIVNFNNIAPGKTVTLTAPDHRLADHADFRLLTAR